MQNEVLKSVVERSGSDAVLVIVVIAVVAILLMLPTVKAISSAKERRLQQYIQREEVMISVVQKNSEVIAELTVLLRHNNDNCERCRMEQMYRLDSFESVQRETTRHLQRLEVILGCEEEAN